MTVTININNLSLVHKDSGGRAKATLPDICLTPTSNGPVPRNYKNIAYSKDIAKGTVTITADGGNMCAHKGSEFYKSIGDELGSLGGIFSRTNLAEATWLTWSPNVFLEGKNACRLSDKMLMNHGNTACLAGILNPELEKSKYKDVLQELCDEMCNSAGDSKIIRKQNSVHKVFKDGKKNPNIHTETVYNKDCIPKKGPQWRRTDATITNDGNVPSGGNIVLIVEQKFIKEMAAIKKSKQKLADFEQQIEDNKKIAEEVTGSKDNFVIMEECDPADPPEDESACCYCDKGGSSSEELAAQRAEQMQKMTTALSLTQFAVMIATSTCPLAVGVRACFSIIAPVPAL